MKLIFYPKLGTISRRVITRRTGQYLYTPRKHLLARLSHESGMTMGQVWVQLEAEREYLLSKDASPYVQRKYLN